jgi:hypothetical protein
MDHKNYHFSTKLDKHMNIIKVYMQIFLSIFFDTLKYFFVEGIYALGSRIEFLFTPLSILSLCMTSGSRVLQ